MQEAEVRSACEARCSAPETGASIDRGVLAKRLLIRGWRQAWQRSSTGNGCRKNKKRSLRATWRQWVVDAGDRALRQDKDAGGKG